VKKYLLAGLLVWFPLAITVWVLSAAWMAINNLFAWGLQASRVLFPASAQSTLAQLSNIPGIGIVIIVLGLVLTGMFATNMVGQWWLRQGSRVLNKIPIFKSIYSSVKQVSDTLFSSSGNAFRQAVLVPYPHAGTWTIAFVTGKPSGEAAQQLATKVSGDWISVYVPTTPNPTSGFFLMVPRASVMELQMSVDEALKYVISMGVVSPPATATQLHTAAALPQ
jgi:uncharacterized membrane protein